MSKFFMQVMGILTVLILAGCGEVQLPLGGQPGPGGQKGGAGAGGGLVGGGVGAGGGVVGAGGVLVGAGGGALVGGAGAGGAGALGAPARVLGYQPRQPLYGIHDFSYAQWSLFQTSPQCAQNKDKFLHVGTWQLFPDTVKDVDRYFLPGEILAFLVEQSVPCMFFTITQVAQITRKYLTSAYLPNIDIALLNSLIGNASILGHQYYFSEFIDIPNALFKYKIVDHPDVHPNENLIGPSDSRIHNALVSTDYLNIPMGLPDDNTQTFVEHNVGWYTQMIGELQQGVQQDADSPPLQPVAEEVMPLGEMPPPTLTGTSDTSKTAYSEEYSNRLVLSFTLDSAAQARFHTFLVELHRAISVTSDPKDKKRLFEIATSVSELMRMTRKEFSAWLTNAVDPLSQEDEMMLEVLNLLGSLIVFGISNNSTFLVLPCPAFDPDGLCKSL